jgi:hypothetical protein
MIRTNPDTITHWTEAHPETVAFFHTLNQHHIDWGLYCGSSAQLLTGNRQSNDIDIVIRERDFWSVVSLISANAFLYQEKDATIACGDGLVLRFPRRSVCFWLDGQEVEVMATTTARRKGHEYHLAMSHFSVAHRLMFEVGETQLYIANPLDTMILKSVLQRGSNMGKHDAEDIASLVKAYPIDPLYAKKRISEVRLQERELDFLAMCGVEIDPTPVQSSTPYDILYAY